MHAARRPLVALACLSTLSAVFLSQAMAMPVQDEAPQDKKLPAAASEPAADNGCIEVVVNGERIPDYACLGKALSGTRESGGDRPQPLMGSEAIVRRPPTQLGIVTPEATRQRMGNTFGKSTVPQRPQTPPPTLPPAIRRP